tara:strand:- start:165409 stop:166002 length:594 start_codon:yes stop_codon:yes gene_type:complete
MTEPETLTLDWYGPIVPTEMDMSTQAMDRLGRPGVYLCLQHYPDAHRVRAYAGVTKDFRLRLREHVAATMGLTYDIYDAEGRIVFAHTHADSLYEAAARLDELHQLAADEVKRMTWFCALDDSDSYVAWYVVEGMLIRRLKALAQTGFTTPAGDVLDVTNSRGGPKPDGALVIRNQGADDVLNIFGAELTWPLEDAA